MYLLVHFSLQASIDGLRYKARSSEHPATVRVKPTVRRCLSDARALLASEERGQYVLTYIVVRACVASWVRAGVRRGGDGYVKNLRVVELY